MTMTAKQLAKKLLENPEAIVEVEITYPDSEWLDKDWKWLDKDWTEQRDDLYSQFVEQEGKFVIVACGGRYI